VKTKLAGQKQKKVPSIINADNPLFDQVDNLRIRAIVYAVMYSLAVFLDWEPAKLCWGQSNKAPPVVEKGSLVDCCSILPKIKKMPGTPLEAFKVMISAYVDAFLFEPANATKDRDVNNTNHPDGGEATNIVLPEYVLESPWVLSIFFEAFALNSPAIEISPGPSTRVCKGVGCGPRSFLELDGYFNCSICGDNSVYCRFSSSRHQPNMTQTT
jgi:hypothetical protein